MRALLVLAQTLTAVSAALLRAFHILKSIRGVNSGEFVASLMARLIGVFIGVKAKAESPTGMRAFLMNQILWIFLLLVNIGAVLIHGGYEWSALDTLTILLVVGSWAGLNAIGCKPYIVAIIYRNASTPFSAYKIIKDGGGAFPTSAVVLYHLSMLAGIALIWMARENSRLTAAQKECLMVEVYSELAWTGLTVVWLLA